MARLGIALLAVVLAACAQAHPAMVASPSPGTSTTLAFSGSLKGQFVAVATDVCGASPSAGFKAQIRGRIAGKAWTFTVEIPQAAYRGAASYLNGQARISVADAKENFVSGSDAAAVVFDDQHSGGVDAGLATAAAGSNGSASAHVAGSFKCGNPA